MSVDPVQAYKERLAAALGGIDVAAIARIGDLIRGARFVYAAGNGGSAATAAHFACDMVKAARVPAVDLSSALPSLTAIGNDDGYDRVFVNQLRVLAQPEDILVVFTVSGNSPNVVEALRYARCLTVALVGRDGGKAAALADVCLRVDAYDYGVVEDVHLSVVHMLTEYLRA